MVIYCDSREDPIFEMKLKHMGLATEVKCLPIGDYWIGDVIIERKDINDFFQSIYSKNKRYYKQLYNMMINNKRSMVYVVGVYPKRPPMRRAGRKLIPIDIEESLRMHKTISYYSFGIPVFQVVSDDDFIKELIAYHNKSGISSKPSLMPLDVHKKVDSIEDIRTNMLGSIPRLGKTAANYLGRNYTIQELSKFSVDDLRDIKIGDKRLGKRADRLYELLNT